MESIYGKIFTFKDLNDNSIFKVCVSKSDIELIDEDVECISASAPIVSGLRGIKKGDIIYSNELIDILEINVDDLKIEDESEQETIKSSNLENLKLCPFCNKNTITQEQHSCYTCKQEKKSFFENNVRIDGKPYKLDIEQADAILTNCNSIITARAGSGKTRVLTAKLIDLFYNQGVKEDEVIAFCFNKNAVKEIQTRLTSQCTISGEHLFKNYDVVKTFHSFSVGVLGNDNNILDDKNGDKRTQLIKQIISNLRKNPSFEKELRKYFLESTLKVDHKNFTSMEHYYHFVRNSRYRTLKGDYVRSIPEKIIADFLFEHNINYKYEWHFYLNKVDLKNHNLSNDELNEFKNFIKTKKETVPDFYLVDYKTVWEHWGISGREITKEKDEFTKEVGDYNEYRQTMAWKKSFWNNWRHKLMVSEDVSNVNQLIETNPDIFRNDNRETVEVRLKQLLTSKGIVCEKLPEDIIMKKVWAGAKDYFTEQIKQFIDKFQQVYIDNESGFINSAREFEDGKEKTFLRLGFMVYQEYVEILKGNAHNYPEYTNYNIDFNLCLDEAAKKIRSGICDHNIKQLKWILIDEYQDFSELFFNLIQAILSRNPNITLFCVGDDWQAINRFAGSDLKFFENFKSYFPNSLSFNVNTNYRCEKHIVNQAGNFMNRFKIEGKSQRALLPEYGSFNEESIYIDYTNSDNKYDWIFEKDTPWAKDENINVPKVKAYIMRCLEIINENPGKKIMILNRTKKFLGKNLNEIEVFFKKPRLGIDPSTKIEVKTVHNSKGEEADVVILPEINENHFPIFHPDANLYRIFGENEYTIMKDEVRLYYVALTRAKHSIYILYSKDTPSTFIMNPEPKSKNEYFYK